jgi:two-component system chemotaxis sensor kinase CheA
MNGADEQFLRELRETFKVEAREHLQAIGSGLLELEKAPAGATEQRQMVETIFRAAHSLKGAARAVNFTEIESICQSLEDLFAAWKRGESVPTPQTLDTAHRRLESISEATAATDAGAQLPTPAPDFPKAAAPAAPAARPAPPPAASPSASRDTDTVRIAVSTLDDRLLEAEEMLAAKLATAQRAADLEALLSGFETWRKRWAQVQPQARTRDLVDFFNWNQDYVRTLEARIAALHQTAEQDRLLVGKLVDDLLRNSKKLLMLPLATLSTLLHKVVRDLCRDQGKEAELTIRGGEITLDKRILDELKDPLIHVLRNCVDHGIETPEDRQRCGKQTRASIALTVTARDDNQVEIAVSDDGAGLDIGKLKQAAVQRGLLTGNAAAQLDAQEARALVFEADISTSKMITQVSGRGLGLAIVREKCERLGGHTRIESQPKAGTTLIMTLPLTLATFRGVLIKARQRSFIVPTAQVERVSRFKTADVRTVEGHDTLIFNGRAVGLVTLADVLRLPAVRQQGVPPEAKPVIVLGAGEHRVAFGVDAVLDEREVLVKRLRKPLSRVRNISGASVLSSGEVALILNVNDLIKSARSGSGASASAHTQASTEPTAAAATAKRVLIAEDSITSRMLLKGILEAAGYDVKTAVDGMDAFTTLRSERFDIVVSDVEMPRMNGFDLTARIRSERALAELPVVLVTALESREDREHGIDVGANAYLVKSSLDQTNLLNAVRRLA